MHGNSLAKSPLSFQLLESWQSEGYVPDKLELSSHKRCCHSTWGTSDSEASWPGDGQRDRARIRGGCRDLGAREAGASQAHPLARGVGCPAGVALLSPDRVSGLALD